MQRGLLVEFSCNFPTLYLIAHWRSFARCEIICPWVTSSCYNTFLLFSFILFWVSFSFSLFEHKQRRQNVMAHVTVTYISHRHDSVWDLLHDPKPFLSTFSLNPSFQIPLNTYGTVWSHLSLSLSHRSHAHMT